MQQMSRITALALMAAALSVPAQATEAQYARRHYAYPPYGYTGRWLLIPGRSYGPISPLDYSIPSAEYWTQLRQLNPVCCDYPYYYPYFYR